MISAEEKRRLDADTKLASDIATEIADRKAAVSDEAKLRSDADIVLDGKITTLGSTESTHFAYLDNKIAAETTRATAAESVVSARVDFLTVTSMLIEKKWIVYLLEHCRPGVFQIT